ncbi:MAG: site-2 protease family protein [Candidatus Colwellbacteria bacterium]|nr:site-2 protease family protein [Candidatus Colwellbacteria bacterium]MBI3273964.1 site-2 protease family protein [Candidatus Colwellbacteria bacterium]
MTTLIIAVIFLAVLIIGHEFGHFAVAKLFGLRVDEFGFGFPPRILSKKVGETEYTLNAIPFGGFVKIYGEDRNGVGAGDDKRNFQNMASYKKALVIVSGAVMNFLIGWLAISAVFMIGTPQSVFVGQVQSGSPASLAGIVSGDRLVEFKMITDFTSFIDSNRGQNIALKITRNNEEININVTPRTNPPTGEGPLGVSLIDGGVPKQSFFRALYDGLKTSASIIAVIFASIFSLIISLFSGNWGLASTVSGPVGIFAFLGTATSLGIVYLFQILGLISLNLAAMNVIPFPALDGGRLFFVIYEKISGGRLSERFESLSHAIGFAILVSLMIAVTIKDIMKLI